MLILGYRPLSKNPVMLRLCARDVDVSILEAHAHEYACLDECADWAALDQLREADDLVRHDPYMKARLHEAMNIVGRTLEEVTR